MMVIPEQTPSQVLSEIDRDVSRHLQALEYLTRVNQIRRLPYTIPYTLELTDILYTLREAGYKIHYTHAHGYTFRYTPSS